jgi:hypothetical protein
VFALLTDVRQHLRGQLGQFGSVQNLKIAGLYRMNVEHAVIVQAPSVIAP